MIEGAIPWTGGALLPNPDYGLAYRVLAPIVYGRVKEIIEHTVASGLIYVNSNAVDFKTPELRPYLDTYLRGSDGTPAVDRVKLMKLLWDAIGSEFGGRHELYERNYAGNSDDTRLQTLAAAERGGLADQLRGARGVVPVRVRPRRLDGPGHDRSGRCQRSRPRLEARRPCSHVH